MGECNSSHEKPRLQRRLNGLQLPLHYQQVIGWIVFVTTLLLNFTVLVQIQFDELKISSIVIYAILYLCHIVSHFTASITDPSEEELRKLDVRNVPEFDRNVHAHVIENGRCHLCNINTSSRNTKHCSLCNKCVDRFDHHCKWLNNCIGKKNYAAFMTCVVTALLISLLTLSLCITDIILFLTYPQFFSSSAQAFINCTTSENSSCCTKYCTSSIVFIAFLIVFCVCALAITCALLHLCCFHIYISILGVSTYEYITKGTPETSYQCCIIKMPKKIYKTSKREATTSHYDDNSDVRPSADDYNAKFEPKIRKKQSHLNSEANVTNLISILVNNELDRAKKILLYDRNKIHPRTDSNGT